MSEIDPTSSSFFDPHHLPNGELKRAAESLHEMITYTANEPKLFETPLFYLATIMHIADSHILTTSETQSLYEEVQALEDSFNNGSILPSQLENNLKELLDHLSNNNNRARIICLLIELEHLLCISSPKNHEISFEIFSEFSAPFFRVLGKILPNIEAMSIYKDLEEIRSFIEKNPKKTEEALQMLQQKGFHL